MSDVAFLVLAHEQPALAARLVRHLAGPGSPCFVHVDAKVPRAPFDAALSGMADATLLDARVPVYWAGFGMVAATLRLLEAARRAGPFARYCLLSGADAPLRPRTAILDRLLGSEREWMRVRLRLLGDTPRREDRRIRERHWMDVRLLNPRMRGGGAGERVGRRLLRTGAAAVNRLLPARRYPRGFVPYKGSQWWCLTDACAAHVLDVVHGRPDFVRFHRTVFAPDEIFFHSIVKASPFARRLSHDLDAGDAEPHVAALHWVRWDGMMARPLDVAAWTAACASSALFARKLDLAVSRDVLARLDAEAAVAGGNAGRSGAAP